MVDSKETIASQTGATPRSQSQSFSNATIDAVEGQPLVNSARSNSTHQYKTGFENATELAGECFVGRQIREYQGLPPRLVSRRRKVLYHVRAVDEATGEERLQKVVTDAQGKPILMEGQHMLAYEEHDDEDVKPKLKWVTRIKVLPFPPRNSGCWRGASTSGRFETDC